MAPALNHLIGELTRLATSLYEFLLRTERNPARPGWREQIERYGKATVHLRLMARNVELQGIAQAAVLQQDFLRGLLHADAPPSPRDWDAMERWPLLLLSCLATPLTYAAIDELVAYYRAHLPADEFDDSAVQALRQGFAARVDPNSARPTAQVVRLPTSAQRRDGVALKIEPRTEHVRFLLQHELLEAIAEYFVFCTAHRRDPAALCHALRLCADRVQLLGISAAGSGMIGLMDCCLLCHDALEHRAARGQPFNELENEQLKTWSGLVSRYLEAPHNEAVSEALVAMHQVTAWLPRLDLREYDGIRDFLKEDTSDDPVPEASAPTAREPGASAQVVPWPGEPHPRFVVSRAGTQPPVAPPAPTEEPVPEPAAAPETNTVIAPASAAAEPAPEAVAEPEVVAANIEEGAEEGTAPDVGTSIWSGDARQLMRIIADELDAKGATIDSLVETIKSTPAESDAHADALVELESTLNRLVGATRTAGLVGVAAALDVLMRNHCGFSDSASVPSMAHAALRAAPGILAAHCRAPDDVAQRDAVVAVVRAAAWQTPPQSHQLEALERALETPPVPPEDEAPPRPTLARAEDVALTIPADANPRLVETLLHELPQRTADFAACVARLHRANATQDDVVGAQRQAHTLKGAANTVGIAGIANLTHHLEDVLQAYASQKRLPDGNPRALLQHASDLLEAMCEALVHGGHGPAEAVTVLQDVLDVANQIDREGLPASAPVPDVALAPVDVAPAPVEAAPALPATDAAAETPALVSEHATTMLRVPASLIDELLRLAGESIIVGGQLREQLKHAARQSALAAEQHARVVQCMDELEHVIDTRGTSVASGAHGGTPLDALEMDQYNELHTLTRRLAEAVTDARELTQSVEPCITHSQDLLAAQIRLQKDVRDSVLRARMVPVSTVIPRLQRAVRQTCRLTVKEAELLVSGDETLIDGDILDKITDPLMHLLRNAIDHGIEPLALRAERGKETIGKLSLSVTRDGDHVVMQLSDDGAGIDFERVRALAVERGLLNADADAGVEELTNILLLPGFTTRTASSQTSGRGIGLDAVHGSIAQLKGSMHLSSLAGQGCTVELRVPLTLISVHCLIVRMNDQLVAVSSRGVERILYSGSGTVQVEDHRLSFVVERETYDAFELGELLHAPVDRNWVARGDRPALLVRDVSSRWCVVFVEQVLASQELVVKPLGPYIAKPLGVEGATILGNGSVVPVMDLNGLLQAARASDSRPDFIAASADSSDAARPLVMVVDDSLSARRNLSEYLRDLGFDVATAVDGVDAVEAMKARAPQLIIADLEMPRMNGLELATHVRGTAALADVPVIMLTSRSTQKHRELASEAGVDLYLTKPFSDDRLVDHIHQLLRRDVERREPATSV
jgi:chemosensory pili system protein ChpA (sensor histidine kinase/response regulator)